MALPLIGAAIGLGSAIAGIFKGSSQRREARRLERDNPFPVAQVSRGLAQNLSQASQMARTGLSQEQYNNAVQNLQRAQSSGFRQAARGVPGATSIAGIVRATGDSLANVDIADAEARRQNQLLQMQARSAVAQDQIRVEDWNERQRYIDTANRVAQLRGAGDQNIWGGIGAIGQMGIMAAGGAFGGLGQGGGGLNLGNLFGQKRMNQDLINNVQPAQTLGVQSPTSLPPAFPRGGFQRLI